MFETPSSQPNKRKRPHQESFGEASWEGRSVEDFQKLKQELIHATSLDFTRYYSDSDYRRLIFDNPNVRRFLTEEAAYDVLRIYDRADLMGISPVQMDKIIDTFVPEVRQEVQRALQKRRQQRG